MKFIQTLLDENKGKLLYTNNKIELFLSFFLPTGKQDEIIFIFEKENMDKDMIISNLYDKISVLENKINLLINNDKKKDSIIQLLEERVKNLENEYENEAYLKEIKQSSIIEKDEINMIIDEFHNREIFRHKKIGFKLLYKATKDGHFLKNFHQKCDNKNQCIVFIKNKDGKRFGGFTQVGFSSVNEEKIDNDAFIFSLNEKKIFKIKNGSPAIYCYSTNIGFKNTIYLHEDDLFNKSYLCYGDVYQMKGFELSKD